MIPLLARAMASLGLSTPDNSPVNTPLSKKWSDLPAEIKAQILDHLDGHQEDLKVCRLIDKSTSAQATRLIFRELHVWPSMNCLKRISKIADSTTLAPYVRVLECHRHSLKDLDIKEFLDSEVVAERLRPLRPEDASSLADQLRSSFFNEIYAQGQFGGYDGRGIKEFALLCAKFPRLETLVYGKNWAYSADSEHLLPSGSALSQRTGTRVLEPYYSEKGLSLKKIWYPSHGYPRPVQVLTSMELLCQSDRDIDLVMGLPGEPLIKMRSFKLIFETQQCIMKPEWPVSPLISGKDTFRKLANCFPHLKELWLGFDQPSLPLSNIPSTRVIARMTRALLSGTFAGITHLTLANITVAFKTLTEFVRRHSTTLRSLTLQSLELVDSDKPSSKIFVSLPKLIRTIHAETSLDHFHLQGTIADITGTRLQCGLAKKGSLTLAVNEYVCHGGSIFPLGILEFITEETCSRIHRPELTVNSEDPGEAVLRASAFEQDGSWKIEVPKIPRIWSREQLALLVKDAAMEEGEASRVFSRQWMRGDRRRVESYGRTFHR